MRSVLTDEVAVAERQNLCLEERVTSERQAEYETRLGRPAGWPDWRDAHDRYVREYVRRNRPPSVAFDGGGALRPQLEPNQQLYRVERIDSVLERYGTEAGVPLGAAAVNDWIRSRDAGHITAASDAALEGLTQFVNDGFSDGRPRFVAFAAEFPGLEKEADWPKTICERCGLAHHLTDTGVTLALFRYSVGDVLAAHSDAGLDTAVFAVPTAVDLPMSDVYFSAPASLNVGHAIGLAPREDCAHLAAELIHVPMAYRAEHWVAVATLNGIRPEGIGRLRATHLDCLRRTPGNADYGTDCID